MILLEGKSRTTVEKLVDDVHTQLRLIQADGVIHPQPRLGRADEDRKDRVTKLDIISGVRTAVANWRYGVWSAVERGVGFRLPHELDHEGNCGEKAATIYAAAHYLRLGNPRFLLYQMNTDGMFHACVLFTHQGVQYIADPNFSDVTNRFKLDAKHITVVGKHEKHYGLHVLSTKELDRYIHRLRGRNAMRHLFRPGQILVQDKTEHGGSEVFVRLREGDHHALPRYKGPTLDVLLMHDEPYHANTAAELIYPLFSDSDQPAAVRFHDIDDPFWGKLDGWCVGSAWQLGTPMETRFYRGLDGLTDEESMRIIAFLDYRRAIEKKGADIAPASGCCFSRFFTTAGHDSCFRKRDSIITSGRRA